MLSVTTSVDVDMWTKRMGKGKVKVKFVYLYN